MVARLEERRGHLGFADKNRCGDRQAGQERAGISRL
jgi:hypothetical protein